MSANFALAASYEELRRQVATAEDLGGLWEHFMGEFVDQPGFLARGRRVFIEQAIEVLETTAGLMMGRKEPVEGRNLILVELREAGVIHGSGVFDGRLAAILFIPELDVGTMAMYGGGASMRYARFWLQGAQRAVA